MHWKELSFQPGFIQESVFVCFCCVVLVYWLSTLYADKTGLKTHGSPGLVPSMLTRLTSNSWQPALGNSPHPHCPSVKIISDTALQMLWQCNGLPWNLKNGSSYLHGGSAPNWLTKIAISLQRFHVPKYHLAGE